MSRRITRVTVPAALSRSSWECSTAQFTRSWMSNRMVSRCAHPARVAHLFCRPGSAAAATPVYREGGTVRSMVADGGHHQGGVLGGMPILSRIRNAITAPLWAWSTRLTRLPMSCIYPAMRASSTWRSSAPSCCKQAAGRLGAAGYMGKGVFRMPRATSEASAWRM